MTKHDDSIFIAGAAPALPRRRLTAKPLRALALAALLTVPLTGAQAQTSPEAKATASPGELQVKVIDAGAQPRRKLRLHPKAGDKQTANLTFKIAMSTETAGAPSGPIKMPPMKVTLDVTVKKVGSDGGISYDLVMSDASVGEEPDAMPQMVDAMKSSIAGLKGLSGTGLVSDRGLNKGVEMKAPPGADPQVSQALDQAKDAISRMAWPLPEEPVGVGASWRFEQPIKSQGMTINQVVTCQLVSVEGDQLSTKTTIAQDASDQKIQGPAETQGLDLKLVKMEGHGEGTITSDLGKILPVKATANMHSDVSMQMTIGGQANPMSMKMDVKFDVQPK